MSRPLASMLPEFRRQIAAFKTANATLTSIDGSDTGRTFACHYESAAPKTGPALNFETPGGYGFYVYPDETIEAVSLNAGDTIAVDGFVFEVQEYGPAGNLSGSRRAWCTKR
jgi:hypothetical protein